MLKKAVYAEAPKPVLWRVGDKSLKKTRLLIRVELQGSCEGRNQDVLLPPHYFIFWFVFSLKQVCKQKPGKKSSQAAALLFRCKADWSILLHCFK